MTRSCSSGKSTGDGDIETHNSEPDYSAIEPTGPPSELTFAERRAQILDELYDCGHPSLMRSQTELSTVYEVDQSTISRDFDAIADHINETLGTRRDMVSSAVYDHAISGLISEGEYDKAISALESWNCFLDDRGDLRELEERLERLEAGL